MTTRHALRNGSPRCRSRWSVPLQVLLIAVPLMRDGLDLEPLGAGHRLLVIGLALASLAVVEMDKAAATGPSSPISSGIEARTRS